MGGDRLHWVVCRRETRSVDAERVACPLRGEVSQAVCLACRYLMTSSEERMAAGWCEVSAEPNEVPFAPRGRSDRSGRWSPSTLHRGPTSLLDSAHADRIAR